MRAFFLFPFRLLQNNPLVCSVISWMLALIITFLSLTPLDQLPEVPGGDKLHHLVAYAALAFPKALARPDRMLVFALIYAALGGGIELLQPYVNRWGTWGDFLANVIGIAIGVALGRAMRRYLAGVSKLPPTP